MDSSGARAIKTHPYTPTDIAFNIKWFRVGEWPGKCRSCIGQVSHQLSLQLLFVNGTHSKRMNGVFYNIPYVRDPTLGKNQSNHQLITSVLLRHHGCRQEGLNWRSCWRLEFVAICLMPCFLLETYLAERAQIASWTSENSVAVSSAVDILLATHSCKLE